MTTLPFLLLALSSFIIFDSDYSLISCPLCKLNTFWNIFMILGRNVEHDETKCHVQEWLSYFWRYFPVFCFLNWFRVRSVHWIAFGIIWWHFDGTRMTLWLFLFWRYLPFLCLNFISCLLCNTNTIQNILMILGRNVEQDKMTCCILEWLF